MIYNSYIYIYNIYIYILYILYILYIYIFVSLLCYIYICYHIFYVLTSFYLPEIAVFLSVLHFRMCSLTELLFSVLGTGSKLVLLVFYNFVSCFYSNPVKIINNFFFFYNTDKIITTVSQ